MSIRSHCLISKDLSFTPYDVKWIPLSSRLCVLGVTNQGTGKLGVYGLSGKHVELKTETETTSALRCGTITGQNRHLATGDFDGQLQVWDTQRFDIPLVTFKAHESIINSIDGFNQPKESQELITGSRDGLVKVWDIRQPEKSVLTIKSNKTKDIWAVTFGQLRGQKVIAVGYEDGDIKLFDVNGSKYLWETHVKDGVCCIEFNKEQLLVSTISGAYIIEIETGKITEIPSITKENTTLWSIRHVPQQPTYFTVAGGDGNLSTFNLQEPFTKPIDVLNLSKHPIISLDWHKDKKGLFTCSSFDQSIKIGMFENI
ncbi:WD40-repeat-containing domain protein [Cokeromyces recurvatus]|uniref:WD40-repeat-containing domain protein n=1 Tax=Cokeromyces recurvatus TaxID=90255 RepID=UPI0022207976|nr:WD40-repeat-containing domain protein [Cokeromyces recurvatus]KAI7906335.1 WD40-repeat-containing domain protein [Cokeromyces recurvatus]